ncbi:2,3-diaminopropionate biosynthesis protein SbnB [Paenibacillus tritici]|uniref:2,3-diaminopropionate biosynthesis protein SbnB n=1 Tax=Paenibacillus tritici TaxID=1873425 RepID=UPI001BA57911|nr:2,3-diaminopropionate biosynthesis protein SbnB [Paenibacillus tritici]QUL56300.1 2,3-diaminopropionate biosynthesis protein SbnB [Paenibacillus tritici]
MLYLNTANLQSIQLPWSRSVEMIRRTVQVMAAHEFSQPIKPYLLFDKDPSSRIIAMPAYVGGDIAMAGIKWIASFPGNHARQIPRAHSVTILNDSDNGKPLAVINSPLISGIRTASVSGLMIREYEKVRPFADKIVAGITGFGPIGQLHLSMLTQLLGDRLVEIRIFDPNPGAMDHIPEELGTRVRPVDSWEEAYEGADLFITCTISSSGYIDRKPTEQSLLLNVSLRDFTPAILSYTSAIIVDDWDEVCRANTDIEHMHNQRGLRKEDTTSIVEVVCGNALAKFPKEEAILFNPMGMAAFDIAIGALYYQEALNRGCGVVLED